MIYSKRGISSIILTLSLFFDAANAAAFYTRIINLETSALIADPVTGMLYASIPGTASTAGNSVVPIDPITSSLGTPIFVGSQPGPLAISDDGATLYVSLDGAYSVRRVDLTTQAAGIQFPLGDDPFYGPYLAEDIEVEPGNPDVIAVSRKNIGISPRHAGVAIYDNGVQRPNTTQGHTGSNRIEYSDNSATVYGYNNETTEFGFRELVVDNAGITEVNVWRNYISGFGVDIQFYSGLVYATTGRVIDPVAVSIVGTYPGLSFPTSVVADADANLVYFLTSNGIQVYDLKAFTLLDTLNIPRISGMPRDLVQWGPDSLAFRTSSGQVFLINVNPSVANVDLSGTIKTSDDEADICAMVLASGQYMFSCNPVGKFSLSDLSREQDGTVKRQIYADGFLPKIGILTDSIEEDVVMTRSGTCPSYNTPYNPGVFPGSAGKRINIAGNVLLEDTQTPICALVLANGQHMFSCDGTGSYALNIPLDTNGQFKLQVYADGFAPTIQKFDEFKATNNVRMARAVECQ